jgi:CDP-glucose 4,6-dehydratase
MKPDADFWRGRRVLLTGHTGFKGGWLALWLTRLGAVVTGVSLPPNTDPSLFNLTGSGDCIESYFVDIRDQAALAECVRGAQPEVVFHLAAQPLVRAGYREPVATFATNVMGTANLLDSLRGVSSTRVAVMITSDKVYRNSECVYPYRETDVLGGHDPYSASKAASELVIASYRDAFLAEQGVAVASARAGNVIGGGDWAEDRLIPDAVRAWLAGRPLEVRRPEACRPWQHVIEPLAGYLALAQRLWRKPEAAGPYNFGPDTCDVASVRDVIEMARCQFPSAEVRYARLPAGPHEAQRLALEVAKARTDLAVSPLWSVTEAVRRTMTWYREQAAGADARRLCEADLAAYEATE